MMLLLHCLEGKERDSLREVRLVLEMESKIDDFDSISPPPSRWGSRRDTSEESLLALQWQAWGGIILG